ncbi:SPFH domain/band 7 family protein [Medicago truncatula]|uniref:SPFH domain/band 7 family protein n=1 Tax=Medicago truncatula TaxID=3880 RepID=G7J9N2_MEDTR|nr:SPFH domain/band 7 family protein [Medicago truncatula]
MANILKPNSARIALRAIPRPFAAAAASATPASIPSRFSSVRCICCFNSRHRYDHKYYWQPPINFGIHFVPEQTVYIVERFGKYFKTLPTGVHFLNPFVDEVVRVHKIWIETLKFHHDFLLTKDQHTLSIDAWVDFKIVDPKLASYVAQKVPLVLSMNWLKSVSVVKSAKLLWKTSIMKRRIFCLKTLW